MTGTPHYEKKVREIERRYEEDLLAMQTNPGVVRYLFLPGGIALAGLAGWLGGHDIGRIELWIAGLVGLFFFSVSVHWVMGLIVRKWIAYKYRQYDAAEADEAALQALHVKIEGAYAIVLAAAFIAFMAYVLWFDIATPLIERVHASL